jgi:hypothetical protein
MSEDQNMTTNPPTKPSGNTALLSIFNYRKDTRKDIVTLPKEWVLTCCKGRSNFAPQKGQKAISDGTSFPHLGQFLLDMLTS